MSLRPFLRWAGSKAQLLPTLRRYWKPEFKRYVEPFCGSAALFFSIQPKAALLSDLNDELISALAQIQVAPDAVSECLNRWSTSECSYYKVRELAPETLVPNEKAARFVYLNALCFNGLYRVNKQGKFNVPYGSKTRKLLFDSYQLREASRLLSNSVLECSDFEVIVDSTIKGDFIYLDPPYATSAKRVFTEYGKDAFGCDDLQRLIAAVERAARRGVKYVISYADVPEIKTLRRLGRINRHSVRRNIAGFVDSRRSVNEVVVTNCE